MSKRYDQYCPVAHALSLIGERWALLVVLELMEGPQRYTDLADQLPGIGTNILAARLKDLEAAGVIEKRKLPPPAASRVYDLTEYGRELRPVMRELALWGARSLGPPTKSDDLHEGWLWNAVDTLLGRVHTRGKIEFHVGDEIASLVKGEGHNGPVEHPDVVVESDPAGLFHLFFDGSFDGVTVEGDRELLEQLLRKALPRAAEPVSA